METVEETQPLQHEEFEMKLIMHGNDRLKDTAACSIQLEVVQPGQTL